MTIFSWVSFYNDKNYIKIFSQNTKCDLFYDFMPLVSLENISNAFNNFNTFLVGINMFKVNKKTLEQDVKYVRS